MRPISRLVAVAASILTLGWLSGPPEARANGRFPKAQTIVLPRGAPGDATIYLRATFGILVSHDGGSSWSWLCEQALGFSTTWDAPLAATRDGRLWIALADGARSTLDGCTVADVPELKGELVADLTVDGSGDHVFAITLTPGKPAFIWRAQGQTFTRLGKGTTGFRFDTIEVAPSKPSRIYLTAMPDGKGKLAHLFRSDDGGATLVELAVTLATDARLFVSGIDPKDPNRIYVRALSAAGSDVLLSTDGGKTLTSVLHKQGAMFGFAQTSDGSTVFAGTGDPAEGIWRSHDRGVTWEAAAKTSVFCLNADGPRLLVCSNPYLPGGYAVAASTDQGGAITPLATFDDVRGPIDCDAGAPSPCASAWPATHAAIVTSAQLRQDPPPSIDAAANEAPDSGPGLAPPRSSACGCEVVGGPSGGGSGAALGFSLVLLATAGRKRRARR